MRKSKKTGSILLFALIISCALGINILHLATIPLIQSKTVDYRYWNIKTKYIALSGLNIAPAIWDLIPQQKIPKTTTSKWLYANLASFYKISLTDNTAIYLVKSATDIYSIALINQKFRVILNASYQQIAKTVKISVKGRL